MLSRRDFVTSLPLGLTSGWVLWQTDLIQNARRSPIGSSKRVDTTAGRDRATVVAACPTSVKILHFCDNHLGGDDKRRGQFNARDENTLADWHRYVEQYRPNLVVVNGDLWHDNPRPGNGLRGLERAARELSSLGVPWAFTWGNHDELDDFDEGHHLLETAPGSLYRGRGTHGNYRVELQQPGAEMDSPAMNLFFLNSGGRGLSSVPLAWLSQTSPTASVTNAPAFAFFHIPIREYDALYRPGHSPGVRLQTVGCTKADSKAFDVLANRGIRACFCGHDHLNDYTVRKESIALHYGRATGHTGYGGDQLRKGAKLIEINLARGNYTQATVFPDGSREPETQENLA